MKFTPLERAVIARISRGDDPYGPTSSRSGARQVSAVIDRLEAKGALAVAVQSNGALEYQLTTAARAALEAP